MCSQARIAKKERAEIDMLRARQVDGMVLASANATGNTTLLRDVAAQGTALVMIDRDDHPQVRCHRVLTDDVKVGRLATAHLIERGRKPSPTSLGRRSRMRKRREEGYREALVAAGQRAREDRIVGGGFMEADGYRAMGHCFSASRKWTASSP